MEKIVKKEWGYERWITNTSQYCTKELRLNKGYRCSLHFHKIKDETFYIVKGKVFMEVYESPEKIIERIFLSGDAIRIVPGTKHRFSGLQNSVMLESSTHHEESDSYRVEGQLSGGVPKEIMKKYTGKQPRALEIKNRAEEIKKNLDNLVNSKGFKNLIVDICKE